MDVMLSLACSYSYGYYVVKYVDSLFRQLLDCPYVKVPSEKETEWETA